MRRWILFFILYFAPICIASIRSFGVGELRRHTTFPFGISDRPLHIAKIFNPSLSRKMVHPVAKLVEEEDDDVMDNNSNDSNTNNAAVSSASDSSLEYQKIGDDDHPFNENSDYLVSHSFFVVKTSVRGRWHNLVVVPCFCFCGRVGAQRILWPLSWKGVTIALCDLAPDAASIWSHVRVFFSVGGSSCTLRSNMFQTERQRTCAYSLLGGARCNPFEHAKVPERRRHLEAVNSIEKSYKACEICEQK